MSMVRTCDICGKGFDTNPNIFEARGGSLTVYNFNDGYNTDSKSVRLDICDDCISNHFTKEELANGEEC